MTTHRSVIVTTVEGADHTDVARETLGLVETITSFGDHADGVTVELATAEPPRSFDELAGHARDVQRVIHELDVQEQAALPTNTAFLAFQIERLAAQFAEACERLSVERA